VTDIDAMHAHLDSHPDDHGARLVLADRLDEEGSPLADGYRALGALERSPHCDDDGNDFAYHDGGGTIRGFAVDARYSLPKDWFVLACGGHSLSSWTRSYRETRRGIDDHVALAFSRLPESRRRELLNRLYNPSEV